MLKAFAQFFNVLSLLFTSAEDVAVSLNKATGVMRANVEGWEEEEKLKLQEKLAKAKAKQAKAIASIDEKAA